MCKKLIIKGSREEYQMVKNLIIFKWLIPVINSPPENHYTPKNCTENIYIRNKVLINKII